MYTPAAPTIPSPQLTSDQLTGIVASISCLVFFVVILILLAILYRKDPLCCKVESYQESQPHLNYVSPGNVKGNGIGNARPAAFYLLCLRLAFVRADLGCFLPGKEGQLRLKCPDKLKDVTGRKSEHPSSKNRKSMQNLQTQGSEDMPPQYYNSRQTLVGSPCNEQSVEMVHDNASAQPGQLFVIGVPSSYHLPALEGPLPRLPSYESVRKKDRQRQIHMMIADRFGLNGSILAEPPPSYEESIRQSVEITWENLELDPAENPLPPVIDSHPETDATESIEAAVAQHLFTQVTVSVPTLQ